ncbi:MAG: hypothetical protein ACM3MK_07405 [Chitinophagales bacterium]
MARMEVNLPDNICERLTQESGFTGEPVDSILARVLVMYFSQNWNEPGEESPLVVD